VWKEGKERREKNERLLLAVALRCVLYIGI
jgi:hypothetical protein